MYEMVLLNGSISFKIADVTFTASLFATKSGWRIS